MYICFFAKWHPKHRHQPKILPRKCHAPLSIYPSCQSVFRKRPKKSDPNNNQSPVVGAKCFATTRHIIGREATTTGDCRYNNINNTCFTTLYVPVHDSALKCFLFGNIIHFYQMATLSKRSEKKITEKMSSFQEQQSVPSIIFFRFGIFFPDDGFLAFFRRFLPNGTPKRRA